MAGVRLDKWLWAARFFKTRSKAKDAIDGGKVRVNDIRGKPSKDVAVDDVLRIRQGWDEKTVTVRALSEQRRGATQAQQLYEETTESSEKRAIASAQKVAGALGTTGKPSKRDLRLIHQFKDRNR